MAGPYENCTLCPRGCAVDRSRGELGFCGEGNQPRIAWAGLHFGEEPPLTGAGGSGTIFFTGCTLKCPYCQNCQISSQGLGRETSSTELADLMLELQNRGAQNVNLVTAGHFTPSVVECLNRARVLGLKIPAVWNSSGYERLSTLEALNEHVDVYLPDCKTLDPTISRALMAAQDYPRIVQDALLYMAAAKPLIVEGGSIKRGVIVRHLVLPGYLEASRAVLEWFARQLRGQAALSLMFQYTPIGPAETAAPCRRVSRREYRQVLSWLEELGIDEGFVQEPAPSSDWLPDFNRPNPFPEGQALPLWHWRAKE